LILPDIRPFSVGASNAIDGNASAVIRHAPPGPGVIS
jgi:hypothetical protein